MKPSQGQDSYKRVIGARDIRARVADEIKNGAISMRFVHRAILTG